MDQRVGGAADRVQDDERVGECLRREYRVGPRAVLAIRAACAPVASASAKSLGVDGGNGGGAAARLMPSVSAMHAIVLAVPITMHVPAVGASRSLTASISRGVDFAGAEVRPEAAAVGARAEALAAVRARQHRPGRQHDRGHIRRRRGHHLRRDRLVAAADQHDGVDRLRADHLLGVQRHQVAQVHAGRIREAIRGSRSSEIPSAAPPASITPRLTAAMSCGTVRMARIEIAVRVGDADDGPRERVVGIAHRLDERLAQEQREVRVAVAGEPAADAARSCGCRRGGVMRRQRRGRASSALNSWRLRFAASAERSGGRTMFHSGAACQRARIALFAATSGNFWTARAHGASAAAASRPRRCLSTHRAAPHGRDIDVGGGRDAAGAARRSASSRYVSLPGNTSNPGNVWSSACVFFQSPELSFSPTTMSGKVASADARSAAARSRRRPSAGCDRGKCAAARRRRARSPRRCWRRGHRR